MSTYKQLLQQREDLEKQIQEARSRELADAVAKVRAIISEYGLNSEDVFAPVRGTRVTAGVKVAPKYRDPATGQTWTGRGKPPKWIATVPADQRDQFAI